MLQYGNRKAWWTSDGNGFRIFQWSSYQKIEVLIQPVILGLAKVLVNIVIPNSQGIGELSPFDLSLESI